MGYGAGLSAGMQYKTRRRGCPDFSCFHDHLRWDAGNPGSLFRCVLLHRLGNLFPTSRMLLDKVVVDPASLDYHVQHSIEDADVAARPNWNEEFSVARDWRHGRIESDDFSAVLALLPYVIAGNGRTFRDIRSREQDDLCLWNIAPRIGGTVYPEDFLRCHSCRRHAEPAVKVDICGAHRNTRASFHPLN